MSSFYICPMHKGVQRKEAGFCPECGMGLIPASVGSDEDFDKHKGHSTNVFKVRFWVSLILSVPIVGYSDVVQSLLNYEAPKFFGSEYLSLILASVIFFYGGLIFITSAYRELRARLPGMMTLIALAISVAYVYSVAVTFMGGGRPIFWELATLITIMLLGHWMEMRAVTGAKSALRELSKLLPEEAEVMRSGKIVKVLLGDLKSGDIALVKPGGRIPADGMVESGESDVDESIVTGESKPVHKSVGMEVIAGTIVGDGSLKVRVTKVGDDTFLSGVMRLVTEAEASKSRLQMLSDRAAYYLTIIAVAVGSITLIAWLNFSDAAFAINRMVAVLVITCPHALGLAIPLVASISTTKAAENGFLVKKRLTLEAARNVDVVFFDKTGTLTEGAPEVHDIQIDKGFYSAIYSLEKNSAHPLAKAIVRKIEKTGAVLEDVEGFRNFSGRGITGVFKGVRYFSGNYAFLKENGITLSDNEKEIVKKDESQARTVIMFANEKEYLGFISLSDKIKPSSKQAIDDLKNMGLEIVMLTGDNSLTAKAVAKDLGIDSYNARLSPGEKIEAIKKYQAEGKKVAMVGDGVNDAPALTQADVGIAIGAGTNVAIESAGIILVKDDPRDIPKIIRLSRFTYAKMIQNLFWATGYNVVAIPLAAGVLAFKGIFLEPALAGFLMSVSTVIVAVNAVFLKKKEL